MAAYTVMSNQFHIVMRLDQERAKSWSRYEALARWTQLFAGNPSAQQCLVLEGETTSECLLKSVGEFADINRQRLHDLSWFMRVLNESIARIANKDDGVKEHFWKGRFKSQVLLDEQAVLSVMT